MRFLKSVRRESNRMGRLPTILIVGAKGLLGAELVDFFTRSGSYSVVGQSHADADITQEKELLRSLSRYRPDIIINCAALINVAYCEANPFEAWKINAFGPGAIVHAIRVLGLKGSFIHISSAYVFGNDRKRFREYDEAHPVNNYGVSKLMGERLVEAEARAAGIRFFIIRTSWLYGRFRPTFVDMAVTKLREQGPFEVIDDHKGVVTSAKNLARGIEELLKNKYTSGTYHLFDKSKGGVTKYDIALEIAETLCFDSRLLKRISGGKSRIVSYPTSAVLVNTKFRAFPDWRISLRAYLLEQYGKEKR